MMKTTGPGPHRHRRWKPALIAVVWGALSAPANAIENSATGNLNGVSFDLTRATVSLTRTAGVVTSAVAEIAPVTAPTDTIVGFQFDLLAEIAVTNTGFDTIAIVAPPGYTDFSFDALAVGGAGLTVNCPAPGAGEYCATAVGNTFNVRLGGTLNAASTRVHAEFGLRTPATAGSANFAATLTHTPTTSSLAAVAGDADGDATDANSLGVIVNNAVVDGLNSDVLADPPIVIADGVSFSTITVTLRDADDLPLAGRTVSLATSRGAVDLITPASGVTDANGVLMATISSTLPGTTTIIATDVDSGFVLPSQPAVIFTQGLVLDLDKSVDRQTAQVGDILTYRIEIRNLTADIVSTVRVIDSPAPILRYRPGSALLSGSTLPDPVGGDPLIFDLGDIPAHNDSNGNGVADPGEPGYLLLSYQMIVGAGARPADYSNFAFAIDLCEQCRIADEAEASFEVTLDPLFDLGTIIGKVFNDTDGDGRQDEGEPGIANAMVVLDDGTYVRTDPHGRYHFPLVAPGHRLLKINTNDMNRAVEMTTDRANVVNITPGLMAKANFGVRYAYDSARIGRDGEPGLLIASDAMPTPVQIAGSARMPSIVVNGRPIDLNLLDVRLRMRQLDDELQLDGEDLAEPVVFHFSADAGTTRRWTLKVYDWDENTILTRSGTGAVPAQLQWDGRGDAGKLVRAGGVYQYQLEVEYDDGSQSAGERRLFGVNRKSMIQLDLTGGAFVSGSHELTPQAMSLLRETAQTIRSRPDEQIIIAGHTDSIGSEQTNQALSERRARAALKYLVEGERLDPGRFLVYGYGESRPIASNATAQGRETNRRVEVRGELADIQRALISKRRSLQPQVLIGGDAATIGDDGRFAAEIDDPSLREIEVEITTADARSVSTRVAIPTLEILSPLGHQRIPADGEIRTHLLEGKTEPGNQVELDGSPLEVGPDGSFGGMLNLRPGENVFGLMARNDDGVSRIVNLRAVVTDRDSTGPVLFVEPIPELVLQLPPADVAMGSPTLLIPGFTKPGNLLAVNDRPVAVDAEGYFAASVELVDGQNKIVAIVTDPDGYVGRIERDVIHRANPMFLLAFADARIASIRTSGNLRAAGADDKSELRIDGRVTYYLKGWVRGKYLVTSAYDSGQHEAGGLFSNLDDADSRRLLTNIDVDRHYPVYGDSSTIVYDTESQGKFYLAVESDQLNLRLGSYALNLADTELAAYRRTLDGAHLQWQSEQGEQPRTRAEVFTSSVRQQAVHDVLMTTGGTLYYLSQDSVIEGSEQVVLVVRDQNTGVVLQRISQVRNSDYEIKYAEGRLLFRRPLSTMDDDTTLIDQNLLSGNPTSIEVDYETRSTGVRQAIRGGRVQRRVGDVLTLGGSLVDDKQLGSNYRLAGVDAEIRLSEHARIVAEIANSTGNDSINFVSTDGGLSFTTVALGSDISGGALKLATEIDLGAMRGKSPDVMNVGAYFKRLDDGFRSGGNAAENGTEKMGLHFAWRLNERASLLVRHDRQRAIAGATADAQTTIQWNRHSDRLKLTLEMQDRTSSGVGPGERIATTVAGQARMDWTGKLSTTLEYQQTLRGELNHMTTVGLDYRIKEAITLLGRTSFGSRGQASEFGARFTVAGNQLYTTQKRIDDSTGSSEATVLGAEAPYGEHGRIYSEYQWGRFAEKARRQTLIGIRRRWYFGEGFNVLVAGEHSQLDTAPAPTGRYTFAVGLNYDNDGVLRARSLNEWRRDTGTVERSQFVTDTFVELDLDDSFTLQGKYRTSRTGAGAIDSGTRFEEQSLGLAYRPVDDDRFNALARITLLSEDPLQRDVGQLQPYRSGVFSADWSYEISQRLEWVAKAAYRIKESETDAQTSYTTRTQLMIQRMNVDLFREFGLGLEYRRLDQDESDSSRLGWLAELMWDHFEHVRLGMGYNFTDFSDDEFSDHEYSEHGWFLRMQGKY